MTDTEADASFWTVSCLWRSLMRVVSFLALLALAASGCAVPATVQVPTPTPRAVAPAGLSIGGNVGTGVQSRLSGSATATLRPTRALGVFASGLLARTDSVEGESSTAYLDVRYAEAGVVGAVPLAEGIWATGSLAFGQGEIESGGSTRGACSFFGCNYPPYRLTARYERRSARLGALFANADGLEAEIGLRIAQARLTEIERDPDVALDDDDVWLWVAEPAASMRYHIGVGTLDLDVTVSRLFGDVPQDANLNDPEPIYDAEATTLTLGATFDLARVFGR